jgi:hypothetical protein
MAETIHLATGHMLCIQNGSGIHISVRDGIGVLTQEHEPDDVVLRPGSEFTVQRRGKTIMMAKTNLRLMLSSSSICNARIETKAYKGSRPVVLRTLQVPLRPAWRQVVARVLLTQSWGIG